jgi:hypothetical protein
LDDRQLIFSEISESLPCKVKYMVEHFGATRLKGGELESKYKSKKFYLLLSVVVFVRWNRSGLKLFIFFFPIEFFL